MKSLEVAKQLTVGAVTCKKEVDLGIDETVFSSVVRNQLTVDGATCNNNVKFSMNESVNESKTEENMTLGGAPTITACVDAALSLESIENTTNLINET